MWLDYTVFMLMFMICCRIFFVLHVFICTLATPHERGKNEQIEQLNGNYRKKWAFFKRSNFRKFSDLPFRKGARSHTNIHKAHIHRWSPFFASILILVNLWNFLIYVYETRDIYNNHNKSKNTGLWDEYTINGNRYRLFRIRVTCNRWWERCVQFFAAILL